MNGAACETNGKMSYFLPELVSIFPLRALVSVFSVTLYICRLYVTCFYSLKFLFKSGFSGEEFTNVTLRSMKESESCLVPNSCSPGLHSGGENQPGNGLYTGNH